MTEILISEETAILAKEKGFDIDTYRKFFECTDGSFEEASRNDFIHDHVVEIYNRPTQSLLQKWLEEDHSIFIDVFTSTTTNEILGFNIGIKSWRFLPITVGDFLDKYEGIEKGLQQALKLL